MRAEACLLPEEVPMVKWASPIMDLLRRESRSKTKQDIDDGYYPVYYFYSADLLKRMEEELRFFMHVHGASSSLPRVKALVMIEKELIRRDRARLELNSKNFLQESG
jgi:hypothetical protein